MKPSEGLALGHAPVGMELGSASVDPILSALNRVRYIANSLDKGRLGLVFSDKSYYAFHGGFCPQSVIVWHFDHVRVD